MATRYVVDTSVLIQRFVRDTYTLEAGVLLAKLFEGEQLYVPEFCFIECTNVFWKRVRFHGLQQIEADQLLVQLLALPLEIIPVTNILPQALQIGLNHQLAVYDSLYIALALNLNCPLITVDERQAQAAIASGVIIKPITDFSATGAEAKE